MARILLVDDEKDVRDMLRDALQLRGHVVDAAASADEALKFTKETAYDVAVVDYVLPGKKKGVDLLQELRIRLPFMKSVIISGQIDHDALDAKTLERELKDRIAADRYVAKPASSEALHEVITELMKPAEDGDWKKMASGAIATRKIRKKDVKDVNTLIKKARKKSGK